LHLRRHFFLSPFSFRRGKLIMETTFHPPLSRLHLKWDVFRKTQYSRFYTFSPCSGRKRYIRTLCLFFYALSIGSRPSIAAPPLPPIYEINGQRRYFLRWPSFSLPPSPFPLPRQCDSKCFVFPFSLILGIAFPNKLPQRPVSFSSFQG